MTEILHTGDNSDYMRTLQSESLDLIYSDILYGTGRDFGDYIDINANRKDVEAFYIPRITEMHRLLKPTGSIYLQMDTRINHWVRCIMDDIFGYDNFKNDIAWKKRENANNTLTNYYPKNKDSILFYTKTKKYTFNNHYLPLSLETIKRYNKLDANGHKYILITLNKTGYNKVKTLTYKGKEYTGSYAWSQKTLDKRQEELELNSLGHLAYKVYLKDSKGVPVSDVWEDLTEGTGKKDYQTKKPLDLMARIVKTSSDAGDVCADFFAGSGSFGVAAKKLNRNVILCDINPNAIKLSQKRMNEARDLFNS